MRKRNIVLNTVANLTPTTSNNDVPDTAETGKMITTPATSKEMQDAIEALLMLGNVPAQPAPNPDDNGILMPIGINTEAAETPVPGNEAVPNNPDKAETPEVGTVLGVAIKLDNVDVPENLDTIDDPVKTQEEDSNGNDKSAKRKTFVTREYGLKWRIKPQRKFKCGVCAVELDTV